MALTDKLSAIGNAIREKGGTTELLTLDEMPVAIGAIETGGGGGGDLPEEAFNLTGDCTYRLSYNGWNWFIEKYGNKITANRISDARYMFSYSTKLTSIPFAINLRTDMGGIYVSGMFQNCEKLEILPEFNTKFRPDDLAQTFYALLSVRSIPDSLVNNFDNGTLISQSYKNISKFFSNAYSLRIMPEALLKKVRTSDSTSSSNYALYNELCYYCVSLDEIKGIPVYGKFTSSSTFSGFCASCHRLKNIIFETNEDGTPKVANWKSQTIGITPYIGYANAIASSSGYITNYNSGITADKEVIDDATYQALKDNPDWFTKKVEYSRYNHDSAVNTINSLPDTSAYLATAGGTNTIKFKGEAGSLTDGGAINTLTEEEIAVAAAKGWTVTFS